MDLSKIDPLTLQKAFPGMQDDEIHQMISIGILKEYPPQTTLCHEGQIEDVFYIIIDGKVQVSKHINESQLRLLKYLGNGDFFGEMGIIHEVPRGASVTTLVPTRVIEINKDDFKVFLEGHSSMSLAMVREVSRRLRENDEMAIDDLRQKAHELEEAYRQLADMEKARSRFLATIAHELRTPLTASNGFVQMIQSGQLSGEALDSALEIVSRNLQEIITLTNDILFLQEMELILPKFIPVDIGAIVVASVEKQRKNAVRNQVSLALNIAADLPTIHAAPRSLERAFTAILDNAIKFSPDGGEVTIDVKAGPDLMSVRIADQGIGITEDVLPHIFERFYHVDEDSQHLFRGVGLGLSIARHVIEQHQGAIEVTSTPGKGSVFTITLKRLSETP
ncbi:MAG: ATP-binding protein [Anaerolineae bacterium]|nr:ATP-binding protein [Anaerolineae bacterium]